MEILNFLDDPSRLCVASRVFTTVKAHSVVMAFEIAAKNYGLPASVLTDNAVVYQKGKVLFESLLEQLGIAAKHSTPYHPQTCGKVERFHQTLKKWLSKQPKTTSVQELQTQIDWFITYYNQQRSHRSLGGATPTYAYAARLKDKPKAPTPQTHFRVRNDKVDSHGKITLLLWRQPTSLPRALEQ